MNLPLTICAVWFIVVSLGIWWIIVSSSKSAKRINRRNKDFEGFKAAVRSVITFEELQKAYDMYLLFISEYNYICDRETSHMLSFYHGVILAREKYEFKKELKKR